MNARNSTPRRGERGARKWRNAITRKAHGVRRTANGV